MLRPLLALLVVALVGLAAAPSYAARWTDTDPVGDANGWRHDAADPLCAPPTAVDATQRGNVDISGLQVRHTLRKVRVVVSFADLDAMSPQHVSIHLSTATGAWMLDIDRYENRHGTFHTHDYFAHEPLWPTPEELAAMEAAGECSYGIVITDQPCLLRRSVDTALDVVRVSVPRTCLGNPSDVRVGALSYEFEQPTQPSTTRFTIYSDAWGAPTPFIPQYGPWVPTP